MSTAVEIAVLRQLLIKCLKVYKAHHLFFLDTGKEMERMLQWSQLTWQIATVLTVKEEQDTSVDNVCYDKVYIKQGSGKNVSVELTDMVVGKGSAESKEEQDMDTSVDNICYDQLPSKLYQVYQCKSRLYV